jgi:hypothetical protein
LCCSASVGKNHLVGQGFGLKRIKKYSKILKIKMERWRWNWFYFFKFETLIDLSDFWKNYSLEFFNVFLCYFSPQSIIEWDEKGLFLKSLSALWFSLKLIFSKNFCTKIYLFFYSAAYKTAENFVIWFKTDYFGHFHQERYHFEDFLFIQNWI